MRGGVDVHRMVDLVRFSGKLENLGFQAVGKLEKAAPGAGSPYPVTNSAPSRARPVKSILAGPDAGVGPPEASGPARIFFTGLEAAEVGSRGGAASQCANRKYLMNTGTISQVKPEKPGNPSRMAPVLGLAIIV